MWLNRYSPLSGLLPLALRPSPSNPGSPLPEPAFVPAYVPALHTSFPPPRTPGGSASRAVAGGAIPFPLGSGGELSPQQEPSPTIWPPESRGLGRDARGRGRLRTPSLPSVELRQGSATPVHATLRDISSSGAGLARRGRLELAPGTVLRLLIHEPGTDRRHPFTVHVRWSRFGGVNTYLGVHFDRPLPPDHPLLRALSADGASQAAP